MPESARIEDLDPTELGKALIRAVAAAAMTRHKRVQYTVRDYYRGDQLEVLFIKDVLSKSTEEIADKWFGSIDNARAIGVNLVAAHLGQDQL